MLTNSQQLDSCLHRRRELYLLPLDCYSIPVNGDRKFSFHQPNHQLHNACAALMNQHEDIGRTEALLFKSDRCCLGRAAWQTPWGSRGVQGGSTEGGAE